MQKFFFACVGSVQKDEVVSEYYQRKIRYAKFHYGSAVYDLSVDDLLEMADFIEEMRREDVKNQLIAASFTAWQLGAGQPGKAFGDYLKTFGIRMTEKKRKPLTKAQKRTIIKRVDSNVKKIFSLKKIKKVRNAGAFQTGR